MRALAAVVVVIAVLFALLTPNFIRATSRVSGVTACRYNLRNVGTALEMYAADHPGPFPARLTSLTPRYLRTLPTCPQARRDTYSEGYLRGHRRVGEELVCAYTLVCCGRNHRSSGIEAPNFPQYTSDLGTVERP